MALTFRHYQQLWNAVFRKFYLPGIADIIPRGGKTTRLMNQNKVTLDGTTIEIEVKAYQNRGSQATFYGLGPMPEPGLGGYVRFIPAFNAETEASNDFVFQECTWRTTLFDFKKRRDSTWKGSSDPITADIEDGLNDIKENFARYVHLPTNGKLADVVNAADYIRDDDSDYWDGCTTPYTAGQTGAVVKLAAVSILRVGPGQMVEFRTSAGVLVVNNVRVTASNPFDNTIFVSVTADSVNSAGAPVVDFSGVSQTDDLFLSGSYNVSPKGSLAHFFDVSSTYYGRDRTDPTYHCLQPLRYRQTAGTDLTAEMLRKCGIAVGWGIGSSADKAERAMVMAQDQWNAILKIAKDAGMTWVPGSSKDIGASLTRVIGEDGIAMFDPHMGHMMCAVDDFAEYGQIDFLDMSTWLFITPWPGSDGFEMIDGENGGYWTRNTEDDGSGRPSKIWSANGIMSYCRACNGAKRNLRIDGLNTAA